MKRTPVTAAVERAISRLGVPSAPGETLVSALSGGPDSVALLDVLVALAPKAGFHVVAAHLDHGLRPDSADDACFCGELCASLGVPFHGCRADVRARAERDGDGLEQAARIERYAFLRRVAREAGAAAIAVAHTRDDQAETVLLRLLRGAASTGLAAMREHSGDLVRPLLAVSRLQVLDHLAARGLLWREDPSNRDVAIPRNRVRHELIPLLEARFNPALREGLARSAEVMADEAALLEGLAGELLSRVGRRQDEAFVLDVAALRTTPKALTRLALRAALEQAGGLRGVGAVHVEGMLALLASPSPSGRRLSLPGGREAAFSFGSLRIAPKPAEAVPFAFALDVPGRVELPGGAVIEAEAAVAADDGVAVVPHGVPLAVRSRYPGDRIRTRGRDWSLRRFLMARRVPADERARLPVVAAGSRVVWVEGRVADPAPGGRPVRLTLRASSGVAR